MKYKVADHDDDDRAEEQPAKPAQDDIGNDGSPRKKVIETSGKSSKSLLLTIAGGVLAILCAVGVWLLFLRGGEKGDDLPPPGNPAPKREMPKKYFGYMPSTPTSISVLDVGTRQTESPDPPTTSIGATGLKYSDLEFAVAYTDASDRRHEGVVVSYYLKSPIDIATWLKNGSLWRTKPLGDATLYYQQGQDTSVVFQPNPSTIVTANNPTNAESGWKVIEYLTKRGDGDFKVPQEQWELLQLVSGYNNITVTPVRAGDTASKFSPKYHAWGFRTIDKGLEMYTMDLYDSETKAKNALKEFLDKKKQGEKVAKVLNEKTDLLFPHQRDSTAWVQGNYLHTLIVSTK